LTEKCPPGFSGGHSSLAENPFGLFRQFFAVCCAHNLFAIGEQILHLQPEMCFRPRTRRGRKRFYFVFRLRGKFCEAFFDSLAGAGNARSRGLYALFYLGVDKSFGLWI